MQLPPLLRPVCLGRTSWRSWSPDFFSTFSCLMVSHARSPSKSSRHAMAEVQTCIWRNGLCIVKKDPEYACTELRLGSLICPWKCESLLQGTNALALSLGRPRLRFGTSSWLSRHASAAGAALGHFGT
ncbi:hypothetical protein BJ508DRAFT_103682 [Ascobolus immersus RN42]|uniref:Uncharacterized protein n=1 Tax=Ascobolus immersus RN42 TaxID=1160509 RepID=A0A3N4HDZ7_ASCIM|nr:hypothetical protein BJ508DRAFT_103682 [Ascobolus immersus RN42]